MPRFQHGRLDSQLTVLVALGLAAAFAWLQYSQQALVTGDSYFHARAAQQLAERGVERRFPQTVYSTWSERYSDKDFLFHALLLPFCADEQRMVRGAKLAVVGLDLALMLALALTMRRQRMRAGWLWLLLLASADPWLWLHFIQVRPHLLGVLLLIVEIGLLLRGRHLVLAGVTAVHVWSHTSFVVVLALPLCRAVARRMRGEAMVWADTVAIGGGVVLASLVHPYFPNNLSLTFDQVVGVARNIWWDQPAIPNDLFGGELLPMTGAQFLGVWPLLAPVVLGGVLQVARWRRHPPSSDTLTWIGICLVLAVATASSRRFAAFLLPVLTLTGCALWTELVRPWWEEEVSPPRRRFAIALAALVGAVLVFGPIAGNVAATLRATRGPHSVEDARAAVAFLDRVAEPEDIVFHPFWAPFAALYYHRPDGRYIEALDPIFLYRHDPTLFAGMLDVYRGTATDPWAVVARDFDARWLYLPRWKQYQSMLRLLLRDPRFRPAYRDQWAIVFEVLPAAEEMSSAVKK